MSQVRVSGSVSGTGILTVTTPNTNTNRTLTLPDNTGTLVSTSDTGTVTSTMLATAVIPVGVGQTWQNMIGSRSINVTYTNSTGRPIQVNAWGDGNVFGDVNIQITVNGVLADVAMASEGSSGGGVGNVSAIVPNGATYLVSFNGGNPSLQGWTELR